MITFSDNIARKPYLGSIEIAQAWLGNILVYPDNSPTPSYETQYLTLVAREDNMTAQFTTTGLSYSVDNGTTWTALNANTNTPPINRGQKIMFKGQMQPVVGAGIGFFTTSGYYDVEGNAMSLLFGDNFVGQTTISQVYAFYHLFLETKVLNARNLSLPATTLAEFCYYGMFQNCFYLINTPQLPATTLANGCYEVMFERCRSLTIAPQLPATTLASYCYNGMFSNCTSLTRAPQLNATTLEYLCYGHMFQGCTSLTTAPALPATTLANQCYWEMFQGCTSLVNAPQLSATTLAKYCYDGMFKNCTSLTTAPALPATTLTYRCYGSMFDGCTSLVNAPQLSATTLAERSYQTMFNGCTSLTSITCLATDISAISCTTGWVYNVAASGTFTKAASVSWPTGPDGIPNGWTVVNA